MKVLVADDSKTMLRIIGNTLNRLEIKDVSFAENGIQAMEKLNARNSRYNLLLTDWNMPLMNGLELIKKVRNDEKFDGMPIVMITTEGGKKEVITAIKAGADDYIVKPFTPEVLKEKLGSIIWVG